MRTHRWKSFVLILLYAPGHLIGVEWCNGGWMFNVTHQSLADRCERWDNTTLLWIDWYVSRGWRTYHGIRLPIPRFAIAWDILTHRDWWKNVQFEVTYGDSFHWVIVSLTERCEWWDNTTLLWIDWYVSRGTRTYYGIRKPIPTFAITWDIFDTCIVIDEKMSSLKLRNVIPFIESSYLVGVCDMLNTSDSDTFLRAHVT